MQAGQAYSTMSLDAPAQKTEEDSDTTLANELGEEDNGYELIENGLVVGDALNTLPERERRLLRMRFVEGMTQGEIGEELGVSQMQISRLLRRTLDTLRARLGGVYET